MISAADARMSTKTARYENAILMIVELINKAVTQSKCQVLFVNHNCDLFTSEMSPVKQSLEQKGFEVSDEKKGYTVVKWEDPVDITDIEQDTSKQPFDCFQNLSALRAYRTALLYCIREIEQGIIDQVRRGQFEYTYPVSLDSNPLVSDIIDTVESQDFTVIDQKGFADQREIVIKWDK